MKEIKDYLHLYLGCEISIAGRYNVTLTVTHTGTSCIDLASVLLNPEFKPILRPLSSMTQGEMNELWDSFGIDGLRTVDIKSNEGEYMGTIPMQWNSYLLLLSKHFDLFGLIEAGLAIDATSLKTPA